MYCFAEWLHCSAQAYCFLVFKTTWFVSYLWFWEFLAFEFVTFVAISSKTGRGQRILGRNCELFGGFLLHKYHPGGFNLWQGTCTNTPSKRCDVIIVLLHRLWQLTCQRCGWLILTPLQLLHHFQISLLRIDYGSHVQWTLRWNFYKFQGKDYL
jgi:hypothetical protein